MAITNGTFNFYDSFANGVGTGVINLDGSNFGVLLTTSTYVPNAATHVDVADITNELVGNGYSRYTLTATWGNGSGGNGQKKLDSDDPVWTASGGSLVARYWVLYDTTGGSDATNQLLAYGLLDNTPADVTATDTNTITITVDPTDGWFTFG